MRAWWRRRSLRARLTLIATACLAVGLGAGSILLLRGFAASRVHAIDRSAGTVADNITDLATAGALPETLPVGSGQSAQVLDATGGVLAVSPGTLRTLPLITLDAARGLAGHHASDVNVSTIDGSSTLSRAVVRSEGTGADERYVVVTTSLRDERDTIATLSRVLLLVAPLLLVAVAATLWLLLGRALGAVTALRTSADAVTDPSGGTRLPLPDSHDEVHALAATLNAMLDRLAAASAREREFVADAAHELRSPLASMRAQLEVAATHPTTTTVEQLAGDSLADVDRLARLVDDLLTLARIDAGAQSSDQIVDIASVVGATEGPLPVHGDARALARAVDNLRTNAQRHARTTCRASARAHDGVIEVRVEDDGPGIPAADRERVFERFVRLDGARARDAGGSGLGLAIVRATARAHGGDVHVTESELGGAAFVLTLPRAADVSG